MKLTVAPRGCAPNGTGAATYGKRRERPNPKLRVALASKKGSQNADGKHEAD